MIHQDGVDIWLSFYTKQMPEPLIDGFGILSIFKEIKFSPDGSSGTHRYDEAEVFTYVCKGDVVQEDSTGYSGVIHTGEFQYMCTGADCYHTETNASQTHEAQIYRISLHPAVGGLECSREQKRFTVAERRNVLCVVASHDGRKGSLRMNQDALIYSSILHTGHHLVQEIQPGRTAWLLILSGKVRLNDIILGWGDSVGFVVEPAVSVTVLETTELLLVDLVFTPTSPENKAVC